MAIIIKLKAIMAVIMGFPVIMPIKIIGTKISVAS